MRLLICLILSFLSVAAHAKPETTTQYRLETVAEGLEFPWSMAFLPSGDYLLTFRGGQIRKINAQGDVSQPLTNTPEAYVKGQSGYFDILLDPDYDNNKQIYLAFAHGSKKANATRVIKATLNNDRLDNVTPIFTVNPTKDTAAHYGGRMAFLNDGTLLITTGDGFDYREAAQDTFSQLGKVIRINNDGSVPADNPFADGQHGDKKVFSVGHRSPQGLVYDSANNIIYLHEHGPKGGDEVNIIAAGANYGWPVTTYGVNYSGAQITPFTSKEGIIDPIKYWVPSIAPSGLAYYNGDAFPQWRDSLFVGALVNKEVRRLSLDNGKVTEEQTLFSEIGERIRDVRVGPDGYIYLLTDSKNGKLIRVVAK